MAISSDLIVASDNVGKLREFGALLAPLGFHVRSLRDADIRQAPEPHVTFLENALAKARHAARMSSLPALADDSGLCVEVLGGRPGVLSARYAGEGASDDDNNRLLIEAMRGYVNRRATYVCVLIYLRHADDPQPVVAQGVWEGEIIETARGHNGFGYDAHFLLPALGKTAAELSAEEKNRYSHRATALQQLIAQIKADPAFSADGVTA